MRLGGGAVYALFKTVNTKNETLIKLFYGPNKIIIMIYSLMKKLNQMLRRPALKASGHVVAERFVGSLFHCLSVAGKNEW